MSSYDRVGTKEFREIKDYLKKHGDDYPGAMKRYKRSFTTVRRIDLSPDWWEYRSHKGLRALGNEPSKAPSRRRIPFEAISNKKLERQIRMLMIGGIVKDVIIVALIGLGIAKLIGG
ncbi:hypothetical protein IJH02_03135 [Candidatus Saccharibacteria bacterium]|nr:hypothetical protein [Candidatus Saccharibacteria bacterium]